MQDEIDELQKNIMEVSIKSKTKEKQPEKLIT